jgi:hypothetical protein
MVPTKLVAKLRKICLALPHAYEESAWVGTRWMIRKKNFAHVVEIVDGYPPAYARAAQAVAAIVLTFRAAGMLYDTLRANGPPFFTAPWGTKWGTHVIGMHLGKRIDWGEVATVITESYRLLAPAKLSALLARR